MQDYKDYIESFISISDPEIRAVVQDALAKGKLWHEPLLQFNPSYAQAGPVQDLVAQGKLHPQLGKLFKDYTLYQHQLKAIELGNTDKDFVVTSGTGSGKSLTYISTIFQHLFSNPNHPGVCAIVVYPMNALINSQTKEIQSYEKNYEYLTGTAFPFSCGQYTGQEDEQTRARFREKPPHILLTNYMMLELLLTRSQEHPIRDAIFNNLKYLVFDELHTYRGRQGSDVAMLIRRIAAKCKNHITCIGTSATMVSTGTEQSKLDQVAAVASTIFGRSINSNQVVSEQLTRSLSGEQGDPSQMELHQAIGSPTYPDGSADALRKHSVAMWLESNAAIEMRDGHLVRHRPQTKQQIVKSLALASDRTKEECEISLESILNWINAVNDEILKSKAQSTILPYKLHQFIAQTGSVYTTLEQGEGRYITLESDIYKPEDQNTKIYPNVFSRASGHPFICVSKIGDRLEPREFSEYSDDEDDEEEGNAADGYLIVGDDIWDPANDIEELDNAWIKTTRQGTVPEKRYASRFPVKLYFDRSGKCSDVNTMEYWGWFMAAPLLFDPTAGVFWDPKTKDYVKLTKLGSEGRSTSTTITTFSILNQLHDAKFNPRDQKLLSFTDNRQDAALQAGHFNDFVKIIQLRSALYHALKAADGHALDFSTLGAAVYQRLGLSLPSFANVDSEPPIAAIRQDYIHTFEAYLVYQAIEDLRRSWKIVLPDLEQCGLLNVEYKYINELVEDDAFWLDTPIVNQMSIDDRKEFITAILDYFRHEYALCSNNYLTIAKLRENGQIFKEKLRSPWSLDSNEELRQPFVLRLDPLKRSAQSSKSIGFRSALGKYIKMVALDHGISPGEFKDADYRDFILNLMNKLTSATYIVKTEAKDQNSQPVPVYQLNLDKIIWQFGDGTVVRPDLVKIRSYKKYKPKPNTFFRSLYMRDMHQMKRWQAQDHTGQLNNDTRLDREDKFRADWYLETLPKTLDVEKIRTDSINALFCSPTMELGIDIGGLSVVHMRNVPPNASNYVQRSGRAGRSGQGALVFTYCSSFSAHDRHYYAEQSDMVSGEVKPARIDLINEELLRAHLNALVISEVGLPCINDGANGRPSLDQLLDMNDPNYPLMAGVKDGFNLTIDSRNAIKASFKKAVADFEHQLLQPGSSWYTHDWVDTNLTSLVSQLDAAMERWRSLFKSATALLNSATQAINTGLYGVSSDTYKKHDRNMKMATRQLQLLRNDSVRSQDLSEFYPYRYLASEGFLPGYNFTRLPLRVFVPTANTGGEYISRPRHIALREFGPLNVIYYNGRKYRVNQMIVQDAESNLKDAKVSLKAGYYLEGDQKNLEICPFSNANLADTSNVLYLHDLMEMSESRSEQVERISCSEEERVLKGYEIDTYFSVDGQQFERITKAILRSDGDHMLNLRYIPAARLIHLNKKWNASKSEGFPIGITNGFWHSSVPEATPTSTETYRLIKLITTNTADALYIEPVQPLGLSANGVITLQYALKAAIEQVYDVESSEIGVNSIGDKKAPNILIYEAAEGSLGILSQIVQSPDAFTAVVQAAKQICRYDEEDYKAPASYSDLLSYYNQRDHANIDRFLIKDALDKLLACSVEIMGSSGYTDYEQQYQTMINGLDPNSSMELKFIDYLHKNGLRMPDLAQPYVEGMYCQPDFLYQEPKVWIFIDGTPHDLPEVKEKDKQQRMALLASGDQYWVWNYHDELPSVIAKRPDLFKKVK